MAYLRRVALAALGALSLFAASAHAGWITGGTPCVATVAEAAAINVPLRNGHFDGITWVVTLTHTDEATGVYGGDYTTQPDGQPVNPSQQWSATATPCQLDVDPMVQLCKDNALIHNSTLGPQLGPQYSDTPVVGGPGCAPAGSPYPGRGCAVVYSATGAERLDADSPWRYTYLVRFTGGTCSTDSGAADSLPPVSDPVVNECPAGTMPGTATMGGTSVTLCTKPIDVTTGPEKEISKDNAGTPQETTTERVSETTCLGDNCKTTITTTTKDATGATVGVVVSVGEADKGTVCAKTPENKVCGKGGGYGNPQDGDLPGESLPVGNIIPDALVGFGFGHGCPASQTFQVFGKSQELSYEPLCDLAPKIKPLVMIASALAALFLVYGALTPRD